MVDRLNSLFAGDDSLLGSDQEFILSSRVAADLAAIQTNAWRLTGQPVDPTIYDRVRVDLGSHASFELSIVDFLAIESASQHDVLVAGDTGRLVTTEHGTLLVGRTSGNRPMIQAVTYAGLPDDTTIQAIGVTARAGLLDRRIGGVENRSRLRRWLIAWNLTEPAITADRVSVDGALNASWRREAGDEYDWLPPHLAPNSSATNKLRWATPVDIFWSHETGGWDFELGPVYPFQTAYDGGYAASEFGPYRLVDDRADDAWIRVRDPATASYIVTRIREADAVSRPVNWRPQPLFTATFLTGEDYKQGNVGMDWRDRQRIAVTMKQYPNTGTRDDSTLERAQTVSIDAVDLFAVDTSHTDSFQPNSNWFVMGESRMAFGRGPVDNRNLAAANLGIFRLNLTAYTDGGPGDRRSNRWTLKRWNTSKQWEVSARMY